MSGRVCAVVVTYNRKLLLRGCIEALHRQTRPPDEIVVVDNRSSDGTLELLAAEFPAITVLPLGENLGGAGGFHHGMKYAFERGYDWMWVMDDDIVTFPDTLERMLAYRDLSGFIHVRRASGDSVYPWEAIWDATLGQPIRMSREISFENGRPWISLTYANFEGALIHRSVVERIGLPDPRFFILGDDVVYGLFASFHTNVICANHVGLRRVGPPVQPGGRLHCYLVFRNRTLIRDYLRQTGVPISTIGFWFLQALSLVWMLRQARPARWWDTLRWGLAGMRDGWRGRYGRPYWL